MNKTIYTAIFGDYEELKEPIHVTDGWKYICFSDQDIKSDTWKVIKCYAGDDSPRKNARYYKLAAFQDYKYSIWVDASFLICCDLNEFWEKHYKNNLNIPAHPQKTDVFKEAASCILYERGGTEGLIKQMYDYENIIPRNNGIVQSGIILRDNHINTINICSDWWQELRKYSLRDQVSFAKVELAHKENIHTFEFDYLRNAEFIYTKHKQFRENSISGT